jgi:hypothetical protein
MTIDVSCMGVEISIGWSQGLCSDAHGCSFCLVGGWWAAADGVHVHAWKFSNSGFWVVFDQCGHSILCTIIFLSFSVKLVNWLNTIECLFLLVLIKVMSFLFNSSEFFCSCSCWCLGPFLGCFFIWTSLVSFVYWRLFSDQLGLSIEGQKWCVISFSDILQNVLDTI